MSPAEWWLEYDTKIAAHKRLTKGAGGFSAAEWDAARRLHKERTGGRA